MVSDLTRGEALAQLSDPDQRIRINAARLLIKVGQADDLKRLMLARRMESDAYVRKWLELAIAACGKKSKITAAAKMEEVEKSLEGDAREQIRAQAIEWVAGVLLHEIGSKIGLLGGAARREINDYPGSETARHITNLEKIFEGVVELRKAAAPPKIEEFDLAQLIGDIVAIESGNSDVTVSVVGRSPLMLFSDPNLLRLVLCNGIRNAIEAVRSTEIRGEYPIVITWEITDREYWVSVIDTGPGIAGSVDAAFEIGRTNKSGHAGFGLAIAKQAMEKLRGSVTLSPSEGGGAKFEIRGELVV